MKNSINTFITSDLKGNEFVAQALKSILEPVVDTIDIQRGISDEPVYISGTAHLAVENGEAYGIFHKLSRIPSLRNSEIDLVFVSLIEKTAISYSDYIQ
jgi:hypothetical protein